jgi:hypothetical protein
MIFLALRSGLWPWGMLTVDSSARGVRANMALRRVKEASIFFRGRFFFWRDERDIKSQRPRLLG